jgi:hypothetical protein
VLPDPRGGKHPEAILTHRLAEFNDRSAAAKREIRGERKPHDSSSPRGYSMTGGAAKLAASDLCDGDSNSPALECSWGGIDQSLIGLGSYA